MKKKFFVLDTNVLMHDPSSIFKFEEHNVFLPMTVLEELDNAKKGMSEVARNARQASRFLNELLTDVGAADITKGIQLPSTGKLAHEGAIGKIHFQTYKTNAVMGGGLEGNKPDNNILDVTLNLKNERPDTQVILVSKDINLRIKATVLGVRAEDYAHDKTLNDVDLLFTGHTVLPSDFWDNHNRDLTSWKEESSTFYRVTGPLVEEWHENQFLSLEGANGFDAVVRSIEDDHAIIEVITDYRNESHSVWGVNARNEEQNYALNLLMNPDIDFVTLLGNAGTGKTLLTLAAGLAQTLEDNIYNEIIVTRVTVPVGEDIGFLPGTEEEKMTPWMGALMDNLDVLTHSEEGGDWGRAATQELLQRRIKIRSLNFMRGRTFQNKFVIIDEAQNLTPKQMKTLITRAGPGTKVICLGNIAQIDTPYLTETTSGLTYVVDRFKNCEFSGHITLLRGERSRLAEFAAEVL